MAKKKEYKDNYDKILEDVLLDENLMEYAKYQPSEITSLDNALGSRNAIVSAVAHIIDGMSQESSEKEIYNTVNDLLKIKL